MMQWLAPFVLVVVIAVLYLFPGQKGDSARGRAMKRDINFYFVCVLAVAIMSVIGSVRFGPDWTDIGTWIVAVIAIFIMAVKFFKSSDVETIPEKQDRGPLERASDRKH